MQAKPFLWWFSNLLVLGGSVVYAGSDEESYRLASGGYYTVTFFILKAGFYDYLQFRLSPKEETVQKS